MENPIVDMLEEYEQLSKELSGELAVVYAQMNLSRQVIFTRLPRIMTLFQRIRKISDDLSMSKG